MKTEPLSRFFQLATLGCLCVLVTVQAIAEEPDTDIARLAAMSLEELVEVEVSSVSKRVEKRTAAAAAVHVITEEDIRRSAATNLPDLLRMAPGVHVASLDAHKRSVSVRGFSGRYANSLLVLIDGRSIYTPLFSGTEWEFRDVMLENIERIEVIRGPGGALWGANAVNGVINIVTKSAADTQGGLVSLGAGTEYPGFGAVRYGDTAGEHGHYRLHLRYLQRDEGARTARGPAHDESRNVSAGARFDWTWEDSRFTVLANVYGAEIEQAFELPSRLPPYTDLALEESSQSGGHILGRWVHSRDSGAELRVQAFYDRVDSSGQVITEERDTFDLELQYTLAPHGRHEWMWGAGFRIYHDNTEGSAVAALDADTQSRPLYHAFVQDRISFLDDKLTLTLGTKLEHNDFTGFEVQPSARLMWAPNERHSLWAAVSRAVRTPALVEESSRLDAMSGLGVVVTLFGNDDFGAEDLVAFETGYRIRPHPDLFIELALFYHRYDNLRTLEIGAPFLPLLPVPNRVVVPINGDNNMKGSTYGLEIAADWKPLPWWRLHMNYSLLEMDLDLDPDTVDIISGGIEDSSPEQQVFLGSYMDIGESVELDVFFRYVDRLPALAIEDYLTADVRLAWRPRDDFEIAVVAHDLLQPEHPEFDSTFVNTVPTETQRGVYGKVTWRF